MPPDLVPDSYIDASRIRRPIAPEVRAAVLRAMGLEADAAVATSDDVLTVPPGTALPAAGELVLEDGTPLGRVPSLPPDAPYGYHNLHADDGRSRLVITGPGRCHVPAGLREWGWAIQLAATRSHRSWGIGDLGDLRRLTAWSASVRAGFVAVSPLGAPNPSPTPEASPYYPSTRRFGNPLLLDVEAIGGDVNLEDLAEQGRALNGMRHIDRAKIADLKRRALERAWNGQRFDRSAFAAWRAEQGAPLERWAIFCVLSERLGPGWRRWPEAYRDPASRAVADVADAEREAVAFHAWVQWCFDRQLADASVTLRRIADMPVGVDPGGFDAWDWQDQFASAASIGAPPDQFNTVGQDWGLPPFVPHRLRAAAYRPFIDTVRAQLRHAGGLRIDHVLGLFRLWWVPTGSDPVHGAYVRQPTAELLEIVAIESHRASAVVIGEDLGTVPAGVRSELRRRRLLSTRLALFERSLPARYPRQSFAGVTTHDLPTLAGIWTGADLADQAASGVPPDPSGLGRLRARVARTAGVGPTASLDELVDALHRAVAASPAMLVGATLEDALRVAERPNLPGTGPNQRRNWSMALPEAIEALASNERVRSLVHALQR